MNRHYLLFLLTRLQSAIERVDRELARSVVEEPPLNPDEPFLFEYIDRLVVALSKKMDVPHVERDPALRFVTQTIGYLQGIRAVAAEAWDSDEDARECPCPLRIHKGDVLHVHPI